MLAEKIFDAIDKNPFITRDELVRATGSTKHTVSSTLYECGTNLSEAGRNALPLDLRKYTRLQARIILQIRKQPWKNSQQIADAIGVTRNCLTSSLTQAKLRFKDIQSDRVKQLAQQENSA